MYDRQLKVFNIIQGSDWQTMQSTEFNIIPELHVNMKVSYTQNCFYSNSKVGIKCYRLKIKTVQRILISPMDITFCILQFILKYQQYNRHEYFSNRGEWGMAAFLLTLKSRVLAVLTLTWQLTDIHAGMQNSLLNFNLVFLYSFSFKHLYCECLVFLQDYGF
jgi:hypothetical protein